MQPFDPTLGDFVVSAHAPGGIEGELISVRTDKGCRVNAWRCTTPEPEDPQASCFAHGYTLQTHDAFGYSILSGPDLKRVLADEYVKIGTLPPTGPLKLRQDDILVWWSGTDAVHSAIVEVPVADAATSQLNEQATIVSSKSGTGAVKPAVSLAFVKTEHRTAAVIEAYRRA